MELFETLSQMDYFNEILIGLGVLFTLFSVLKIIGSSIKLLGWVLLAGLGVFAIVTGLEQDSFSISADLKERLRVLSLPGKELSLSALKALCAQ